MRPLSLRLAHLDGKKNKAIFRFGNNLSYTDFENHRSVVTFTFTGKKTERLCSELVSNVDVEPRALGLQPDVVC